MRQLVFVRHSIAEDIEKHEDDFSRNLTNQGIERIHKVINKINPEIIHNAIFLTSSANRCIQTCQHFAQHFSVPSHRIKEESFLYSCFREHSFFYFLEESAANEPNVWIFGHNPMLSNLTEQLLNKKFYSLPKGAVVAFASTALSWIEVNYENTSLIFFINPKEL
ncbi:MAG: histidine phosphatase family protein [Bacteroidales bacterium]|nr:histidine phosphatase family protein [Bacteroidales bacterium]